MNRHYISLELDKVLSNLSKFTANEDSRLAAESIQPQSDLTSAQLLMDQTSDAHMLMARFGAPSFGGLYNVNNSLSIADAGGVLSMRELLDIAQVLRSIRGIVEWRDKCSNVQTKIDSLFDFLTPNKFLEDKISSAIISDEEMSDNASPALYDIRRKMRAASSKVRDRLDKMIHSPHYQKLLREPIITMRNGRYVVPVKIENRAEVKGLVHDTSSSGATVFIEPADVVEANNEIRLLQSKERDEIERILSELSALAGSFYPSIKQSRECALELDLIFAKAKYAYELHAGVPMLNNTGKIKLNSARHPLIDPKTVVATDISLGIDFDSLIITGPNTGGKTVSIKTLGLLSLMAMCGLMLPVSDRSEVSVFDNVFADIGDEQSIEQSLSTFSSHMTNIVDIINNCNEKSLVLIDELGAGTDPVEGAALAIAILERIHKSGAKIAATTHYAELKSYALQTEGVENASCEFDVASLKPTYRLLIGVPGRSNAFAISKRLGLDDSVIQRAGQLLSEENTSFERTLELLEKSRIEYEQKKIKAEQMRLEADKAKQKADEYKRDIEHLRQKEIESARTQATKIVDQAKRSAYAMLQELEKLKQESKSGSDRAEALRKARQAVRRSMEQLDDVTEQLSDKKAPEGEAISGKLKIGQEVLLNDIGKTAIVTGEVSKKGEVEVLFGDIKMRTPVSNLRQVSAKQSSQQINRSVAKTERVFTPADSGKGECDLRGMNVEEAILEIDRKIDQCMRSGLSELWIIHGKGTGALRRGVQDYLRKHKYVSSFRVGTYGEGENGVTIAKLK